KKDESTLLHAATRVGDNNATYVNSLLAKARNSLTKEKFIDYLNRCTPLCGSPLWYAAAAGKIEVVQLLLTQPEINPNSYVQGKKTVMEIAVESKNYAIAQLLLA